MSAGRFAGIRYSIATKLLRVVFSLYLVIAVGVTISHMVIEYRYQKNSIGNDLINIQKSFEHGLSVNLWQLNQEALESEINGMLQIPEVVGVTLQNEKGEYIAIAGIIMHNDVIGHVGSHVHIAGVAPEAFEAHNHKAYTYELFEHQFPITYAYEEKIMQLGTATINSSSSVVYQRVKLGFLMLVVNALIKTAALWLIFLWFSNILLRKPLTDLTTATNRVSLENLDSFRVDIKTSGRNELKMLEESFNSMIANLHQSIVEKKDVDTKLIESEERYRNIIEYSSFAIATYDESGQCIVANQALSDISGGTVEQLLSQNINTVKKWQDSGLLETAKEALASGENKVKTVHLVSTFGEDVWLNCTLIPYSERGKKFLLFLAEEITERKKIEEDKQKIHKLESIGVLAGGIAHDFNNILAGILNNVYLSKMHIDRESKEYKNLESAEKAIYRATNLTRQLLTFSRGGAPIKKTVSIIEIIKESAEFALKGSNVKCEYDALHDLWPVEVDEGQMNQVIHNLILNANQAMPEGGVIRICIDNIELASGTNLPLQAGRYVKVVVQDQGIGIDNEHLMKIFDPYYSTKEAGRGLGLSITYSIINQHDGYISAESDVGVGTTFTIYLPASDKQIEEKEPLEDASVVGEGKILLMDDEEIIRESVGELLSMKGYEVEYAKDGEEAIELYEKSMETSKQFDVVILDLTIRGGMGGKETIKKLLEINSDVKAIVSSGYSNNPVMANYKEYGFSEVFNKASNNPDDLCRILNKVI